MTKKLTRLLFCTISFALFCMSIASANYFDTLDPAVDQAYREYSIVAEELGRFVTKPLEDFVAEFEEVSSDVTLDEFLADQIELLQNEPTIKEMDEMQAEMWTQMEATMIYSAQLLREILFMIAGVTLV